jgi:excisionase family DNA binding protein
VEVLMDRLLLKPDDVADRLSLGRSQIYEMPRRGELPAVRIGRAVRVPVQALNEWIAGQTKEGQ